MSRKSKIENNEINLIELMQIIWNGKWKIAIVIIITFIATIGYKSNQAISFTAKTEIKPVTSLEINKYYGLNNLFIKNKTNIEFQKIYDSQKITRSRLYNLYLDILREKSIFEDAIRKYKLLDDSQYDDEKKYNDSITKLASSIKILAPVNETDKIRKLEVSNHTISFNYDDEDKWKSVLKYSDELANKLVKKFIADQYKKLISNFKKDKMYQLQDLSVKINNSISDYDREIFDRLAFLKEQSEIARQLQIKNIIESLELGNDKILLANRDKDVPFYLRGYEAIDKEIELISKRKNVYSFVEDLFKLEKEKRKIEQDKFIERIEIELQSSPIASNSKFLAASISYPSTKFEYKNTIRTFIPMLIGLIIGVIYVIISSAFKSQNVSVKRN